VVPEFDPYAVIVGDRNALQVNVSHDLGDRTLVVVILLALVIGACGVAMGLNLAKQDQLGAYTRDLATQYQLNKNHVMELEKTLEAQRHDR
jgi:outer membrane murein-binding lipoprotein Lpp